MRVAAYTLMSNHFHLVAIGDQADAVSLFMMDLSGLYATYRNAVHRHTGQSLAKPLLLRPARFRPLGHRSPLRRTQPRTRAHRRAGRGNLATAGVVHCSRNSLLKNLATAGVVLHEPGGNVKSIRWDEFGGG